MEKLLLILFIFTSCFLINADPVITINDRLETVREVPVFRNPPTQVLAVITDPSDVIDRLQPTIQVTVLEVREIKAILQIDLWIKINYICPLTGMVESGWVFYGVVDGPKNFTLIQGGI